MLKLYLSVHVYFMGHPRRKVFLKLCNLLYFIFIVFKLTITFQDKSIILECKLLLFYQNHQEILGLSVWSITQCWGKTNINLYYRDFAQNAELRHTPWKLLHRRHTVNCKHHITKLIASGCGLDRTSIGGFRRQHGYYSHISTSVKKLVKTQHFCIISFWVNSMRKF